MKQDPPVSIPAMTRKPLIVGVVSCLVLVFGIGGWAATTQLSGAVIAPGKLVVDTNVKKIQHPTGGVVGELPVKEGDRVKQGDVVVRLDGTQAKANLGIVTKSLDELAARQARFEAERDNDRTVEFPPELTSRAGDPEIARLMSGEQKLFEMRRTARDGQKAQLREQIKQLNLQIDGTQAQEVAKGKELALLAQELDGVRTLWKQNLVPISRVTTLERDSARMEGERSALVASLAQSRGRIAELELKIHQIDQDLSTEVGKELAEIRAKKSEMTERRVSAEDQLKRIDLVSPQDGKVFQRNVHTVGGVVQAGEPLMLIVPDSDALIVDAKVVPQDIDQIHVGQHAVLRFAAFNQRTTPEVDGEVIHIGADVTQEDKATEPYYSVRIRVSEGELSRLEGLQLLAGMPVEAFIQTTPRTVASFLVKPLSDQLARAFRGR
ncbi:MAG: HlyD family type I secretion periplasmic adaptor subunit [Reyranella sp.]|uniref:HlyD family type I secretion periplasmic adaptor subunit n=1 Tax=Reyranella sp. TaxID=1929291 RepID=UPI001227BC16|nr:HlyD family type I secretion periplasmic adaptor subunit [Reyranella sp.]TAJ87903.1 MAG: HlyD family type I secretion periplasmic adaptor subunit [Reyranella sp.]TBR30442.1 MAG: HlyD family type I secretion periplasmic adaptor subunit [Reyranella sp.]